jgi:2-polyprenyl-6-hydroxyphenyl methylase/3-demethylubiquinone-9 3-methyltransferase
MLIKGMLMDAMVDNTPSNVDEQEVEKFSKLAARWWDKDSEFKPLHAINPLRLGYVESHIGGFTDKKIIDVGCGGGILSESMAAKGADVTGIDLSEAALQVAKLHLFESDLKVDYQFSSAEDWAEKNTTQYDVVTCLEMLEHVPDPLSVIKACQALVKPDGWVFFSTINRNPKSYLFAIIGAEYLLKLLPKGTHEYAKFIRPSELSDWAIEAGLSVQDLTGMTYNPFSEIYRLEQNVDVNYLMATQNI